jgi:hypothetical protein
VGGLNINDYNYWNKSMGNPDDYFGFMEFRVVPQHDLSFSRKNVVGTLFAGKGLSLSIP